MIGFGCENYNKDIIYLFDYCLSFDFKVSRSATHMQNVPLYSSIVQGQNKVYNPVNDVECLFYLLANLDSDHL